MLFTPLITVGLALVSPLMPLAAPATDAVAGTVSSAVSVSASPVTLNLADGSTVSSSRPTISGTAKGVQKVGLVRGNEIMGQGVVNADGRWQLHLVNELKPGENDMQLLTWTSSGVVSTDYTLTYSTAPVATRLASVTTTSLGYAFMTTDTVATARPEVEGIASPGVQLELRDSLGNVYGQATADDDWDFRMTLTRDLRIGPNSLVLVQRLGERSSVTPVLITRTA